MITPSESFAGSDRESTLKSSLSSPVTTHLATSSSPVAPRQNLLPSLPSLGFLSLPLRPPPPQPAAPPPPSSNRPKVLAQHSGFSSFTISPKAQKVNIPPAPISSTAQISRFAATSAPHSHAVPVAGSANAVRIVGPPADGYFRAPQMFNFGAIDLGMSTTNAVLEPRTEPVTPNVEQKLKKWEIS